MTFEPFERDARQEGYARVAGVDEAGRGPLAGPVVAAAVVLPDDGAVEGLQDSKRLTARQRERVYAAILRDALDYGIGMVSNTEIDRLNILQATREAMRRALAELQQRPDLALIDGNQKIDSGVTERTIVRGDARCASVAAASVVAKVSRDRLMTAYAARFPGYGFEQHKGYPTRAHYERLRVLGPCAIHRLSFRGVAVPRESGA
ncbi:MAG: ribonuclease HII [Candidatus Entotheonella factor]|uniref:Ribonuclease HII n=1 Tax=Entotheonella factor TaxID=1429438 RepID=W4LF83_ENTF1|nr:ribonuclease HII [Candidatus Entotheonella palauensis]ETW96001.1 MAG: ribonuclease HII [Candidatus Entotheonella factor]